MQNLLIKSPGQQPGVYPVARRGQELQHLSFTIVQLGESLREHTWDTGEEEASLDFYTGPVRVTVAAPSGTQEFSVQRRASIAEAAPMLYVPAGCRVSLVALEDEACITIGSALGKPGSEPVWIDKSQAVERTIGRENWQRRVLTHIAENVDAAHLICGETVSEPGGWSSCPPHKHDSHTPPSEVPMEEIYYFQCDPPQGFGFIRVYTDPLDPEPFDLSFAVEHGDTVLIPRGYHPVAACPGYTLNYTWILAGEGRVYGAWSDDPRHAWIKG